MQAIDLAGKRFGKLVAVRRVGADKTGSAIWECVCDCGTVCSVTCRKLTQGKKRSCGCFQKERKAAHAKELNYKHGGKGTRLYGIWKGMKERCNNPNPRKKSYKYYYCRGIKVCDEWTNSFEAFRDWAITHGYQPNLTIDRIDVNGNYEPGNCRWATWSEQNRNRRPWNRQTTKGGEQ